jgi:L-threonylcarbamoyladenylate synthase
MTDGAANEAVEAIRAGKPVILPTDTVYGLCTTPYRSEPVERLYRLKGREPEQPTAIIAADLDLLFECIPELRGRAGTIARALLPGPYTLILSNPARRFRWLAGTTPAAIGVRVPELPEPAASVLARVGAVAATSANLPGGPDPCRLADVPEELRAKAAAALDGGELPGTPSTVLDFSGPEPRVVREGAAPAAEALARVRDALGG